MNPKPLRQIDLYGKAGRLEALYRELQDPAAVAVVCHPLPTHGGTLHNKVVFRAARGLENANVATLRFNFRGVGASTGQFDGGEGEQDDFLAALAWVICVAAGTVETATRLATTSDPPPSADVDRSRALSAAIGPSSSSTPRTSRWIVWAVTVPSTLAM